MLTKEIFLSWGMLIVSVLFNVVGVFVIKLKLNELGIRKVESLKSLLSYFLLLVKSPLVVLAVVLFFVAPFLFVVALSRMELAVAYPVQIGLNFILLVFLAVLFLGEQITFYKAIGMALILLGIFLLNKVN